MFGKNPVAQNHNQMNGLSLRVVSEGPFYTLQGEGPYAGVPAVFIRLHGCNLRCWFCDTEFSNPDDRWWGVDKLVKMVENFECRLVVITGGEPMRQNIAPLCKLLSDMSIRVQIETAGTLWVSGIGGITSIVVSPKTPVIHKSIQQWASAFKYVVSADMEITKDGIPITATQPGTKPAPLAAPLSDRVPVYYSPMDEYDAEKNQKNVEFAAQLALAYRRHFTVQLHKLARLP